jgi:hypothetical protein
MEIEYNNKIWYKPLSEEQIKHNTDIENDDSDENYCECCGHYIEPEKIKHEAFTNEEALNICVNAFKIGTQVQSIKWGTIYTIVEIPYLFIRNKNKYQRNIIYVKVSDNQEMMLWKEEDAYILDIRI